MSQKQINQWRSVGFAFLVLAVLAGVMLVVALMDKASQGVVSMYGSLTTFAWIATIAAFGKSLGEKTPAGEGGGLLGIFRALMGSGKMGGPPAPPTAGFAKLPVAIALGVAALLVTLAILWPWLWIFYGGVVVGVVVAVAAPVVLVLWERRGITL